MEYKLLSVSKYSEKKGPDMGVNIGDYIQALAASQFLPEKNGFIDRDEELSSYEGEQCKMIMNGWFMHNPTNFPPSKKIIPLFISFHLSPLCQQKFFNDRVIQYLKRFQPIGCRDSFTVDILNKHGIESYFSGCLTLTLGYKYKPTDNRKKIYIVDPVCNNELYLNNIFRGAFQFLSHPLDIIKLMFKMRQISDKQNFIKRILKIGIFYQTYSKGFSKEILLNATYITHDNLSYKVKFHDEKERLKEAERLIDLYKNAKLVVTSRLHCALPCLGMDTPVIYIKKEKDILSNNSRIEGLERFLNILLLKGNKLIPNFEINMPVSKETKIFNNNEWKELAAGMKRKCIDFLGLNENHSS